MKTLLYGLAFFLFSANISAQKVPVKFGDVSVEELKMQFYEKDSSAAAVILADFGVSHLSYSQNLGFSLNFERIRRIKILRKEGLEWADFIIPLYHDGSNSEKVTGLKAVTYNLENGKIVETKIKNDAVFKEKLDNNVDLYKGSFPNVKEGSVLELTYKITSDFLFNFQDWEFQSTIPVVWSEYRARIPEYFNYEKYTQGYVGLSVSEQSTSSNSINLTYTQRSNEAASRTTMTNQRVEYLENKFRWAAQDVPAFKSEPFMTTYKDYISKITFELAFTKFPDSPIKFYMGSWEDINKTFSDSPDFGGLVSGNNFLKKQVEELTFNAASDAEKVSRIFEYVRENIAWDEHATKYVNSTFKKVLEEKKGNSSEINLLL